MYYSSIKSLFLILFLSSLTLLMFIITARFGIFWWQLMAVPCVGNACSASVCSHCPRESEYFIILLTVQIADFYSILLVSLIFQISFNNPLVRSIIVSICWCFVLILLQALVNGIFCCTTAIESANLNSYAVNQHYIVKHCSHWN